VAFREQISCRTQSEKTKETVRMVLCWNIGGDRWPFSRRASCAAVLVVGKSCTFFLLAPGGMSTFRMTCPYKLVQFRSMNALLAAILISSAAASVSPVALSAPAWPQFRGTNCSETAADARPPLKISPTNGVMWVTEGPWSPSSPCVWGEQILRTHDKLYAF